MATRLYTDPLCLQHLAGPRHPESPQRLAGTLDLLHRAKVEGTTFAPVRPARPDELAMVHHPAYLDELQRLSGRHVALDPDTAMSPHSYQAALLAAGASLQAVEEVLSRRAENGFVLVRPPGHHAEADRAMGFCLFNNVAVAAQGARRLGAQRVMVLDWDVHHGNGTQSMFYDSPEVLYLSAHQFPYYPGTGAPHEVGAGAGAGFTVNCGLPPGQGDADYGAVFLDLVVPIADAFRPDLILVSAGFDPHRADPLAGMRVTERGFAAMCSTLKQLAQAHCAGRLVLILEGGYDVQALAQSVHACTEVLAQNRTESFPTGVSAQVAEAIRESRERLKPYWKTL